MLLILTVFPYVQRFLTVPEYNINAYFASIMRDFAYFPVEITLIWQKVRRLSAN